VNEARHDEAKHAPFDTARLDSLLENEGIDVLVATSKHNVQYLLGGYRFFFFDYMDAIGVSRYLPVVVYQKGRPDNSAYIGCHLESHEKQLGKFWPRVRRDDFTQQHQRDPAGRRAYQGAARADRQGRRRGVLPTVGRR
jgi:Xaa-Pro aminopeptidase